MADQFAQDRNMVPDSRAEFEADAEPMGFDLTRISLPTPEPWSEYADENTGHRWGGWLAATQRQQERITALEAQLKLPAEDRLPTLTPAGQQWADEQVAFAERLKKAEDRVKELEAQVQALSLDAGRYRWIRSNVGDAYMDLATASEDTIDQRIDAEIAAGKGEAS